MPHSPSPPLFRLGVFAKYWEPGHVKTRLAESLGASVSAEFYRQCLAFLIKQVGIEFTGAAVQRWLAVWPAERATAFESLAGDRWQIIPQTPGDLGKKMKSFFETARLTTHAPADSARPALVAGSSTVLIGSDSPTLPVRFLEQAFAGLATTPVVLGPAIDGGYCLIGIRDDIPLPPIFDAMPWSSGELWPMTCRRLERAGIPYQTLPPWYDVDEYADLVRLRNELRCRPAEASPSPLLDYLDTIVPRSAESATELPS